jgi:flagellar hook-associated protein 3 FlgL
MSTITASGFFLNNLTLINKSETELQALSNEQVTGNKSTSLAGYGTAAPTIINLNGTINQTQAYVDNSTQVSTILSAYDSTLTELQKDATQLSTAIGSLGADDATSANNLQDVVQGLQVDVTATLNAQVGNRFLYAGTRYTTQPVVDLTQQPTPTTPTAFTPVTPNALPAQPLPPAAGVPANSPLPSYDTQGQGTPPGTDPYNQAYATQNVNVTDSTSVSYGVTSNDPSIQALVYALQQAKAAATATQPQQAQFLANANSALITASAGLQSLQQSNDESLNTVTNEQTTQKTAIGNLQSQLANLTTADPATVAAEFTAVQNQLQGSFQVTSTILNLSLLSFIK